MSAVAYWFWSLLTLACLLWYSTVAVVVAFKGAIDIRGMLRRLQQELEKPGDGPGTS